MKKWLGILGAAVLAVTLFTAEQNTYQTHALDEEDLA